MKYLPTFMLALLANSALAAEPAYTCKPEHGCIEVAGPNYDIGRGVKITLPDGWKFFSYPTAPDPIMKGLREIRATKNDMVIAITPMPNVAQHVFSESELCDAMRQSGAQYVNQSKEKSIKTVSLARGELVGCHVAFTAANDGEKPFAVLPNRHHASVTTLVISYKSLIFSVSVVSEHQPDDEYAAAVNAIRQMQ